jgi:hypothetical protein
LENGGRLGKDRFGVNVGQLALGVLADVELLAGRGRDYHQTVSYSGDEKA